MARRVRLSVVVFRNAPGVKIKNRLESKVQRRSVGGILRRAFFSRNLNSARLSRLRL